MWYQLVHNHESKRCTECNKGLTDPPRICTPAVEGANFTKVILCCGLGNVVGFSWLAIPLPNNTIIEILWSIKCPSFCNKLSPQVTVILIGLCQAWMGVFSAVVYAGPTVALKICPMVSALSAFTSGFLVPEPNMPHPFTGLFFINPTFWAIKG